MDVAIIVALVALAGSLGAGALTFRASSRANLTNDRKVDLEEHRDAIERLRKIIDEQDKHVERVRLQLDRVQEALAREQGVSHELRAQIRSLQNQVDDLIRSRERLERLLAIHAPGLFPDKEKGIDE